MIPISDAMSESELRYYPRLPSIANAAATGAATATATAGQNSLGADTDRLEPATCTEAEPFALRVQDDSMQPEFRTGCIIVIDPTGRATDGSYVLADDGSNNADATQGLVFRQLRQTAQGGWILRALNDLYPDIQTADNLSKIIGVIVQRAGVRRSYHKRYDVL